MEEGKPEPIPLPLTAPGGASVSGTATVPSTPAGANSKHLPARPTRALTCLDLTLQCVVFQDKAGLSALGSNNVVNLNRMAGMRGKDVSPVQMYSQRMVRLRMTQNQRRQNLPWFGSTTVVPQGNG